MDSRQSRNPTQDPGNRGNSRQNMASSGQDPGNRGNSRQNMASSGQPMVDRQNSGQKYANYQSYEKMDDLSISKNLSNILRHSAEKLNLNLDAHGYIFVDDLLKLKRFTGVTPDDIKRIVKDNDKQRFSLITEERSQKLKIRANQGHSGKFENLNLDLVPIEDPEKYPLVLHGTYETYWSSISKEGLKKMKRVHIHFAAGLPGENGVISGMRKSCEIYIYIDLKKAMQDGLKFFLSANNVILSSGDKNGIVAPKYFSKVVHYKHGNLLKGDDVSSKKKLPVGMVEDDKSKNEQSKKKSKSKDNAEKNSTDKEACNPKKKKVSEENNGKTEDAKNSESKKKGKNSKKEVAAEKITPVKPVESKTETGGKKKGADKPSTTVAENPGDASKNSATKKNKNQDKKSADKEAGDPKKKKLSEENNVKIEDSKNSESKKKNKKSKKEGEAETNSTVKPTESKMETASKKKGSAKSPVVENSGGKASNNAVTTKKTKNQDKKSSDSSKVTKDGTKKAENKNAVVKNDVKANASKPLSPSVFIIDDAKDERLQLLKQQSVVGVYVLKQKENIEYVLISMQDAVFVFNPAVDKELLKVLLEKGKSKKVMYDCRIVYDLYQQCGIVLYNAPVADIQILQKLNDKRPLSSLAEIVGEVCGKIPAPAFNRLFEPMAEKLEQKTKNFMKILSQVSGLKNLFDEYKSLFEKTQTATFTKYNDMFDEVTKAKLSKSPKDKPTDGAAVKKPASQPTSTDVPKKSKKNNK